MDFKKWHAKHKTILSSPSMKRWLEVRLQSCTLAYQKGWLGLDSSPEGLTFFSDEEEPLDSFSWIDVHNENIVLVADVTMIPPYLKDFL